MDPNQPPFSDPSSSHQGQIGLTVAPPESSNAPTTGCSTSTGTAQSQPRRLTDNYIDDRPTYGYLFNLKHAPSPSTTAQTFAQVASYVFPLEDGWIVAEEPTLPPNLPKYYVGSVRKRSTNSGVTKFIWLVPDVKDVQLMNWVRWNEVRGMIASCVRHVVLRDQHAYGGLLTVDEGGGRGSQDQGLDTALRRPLRTQQPASLDRVSTEAVRGGYQAAYQGHGAHPLPLFPPHHQQQQQHQPHQPHQVPTRFFAAVVIGLKIMFYEVNPMIGLVSPMNREQKPMDLLMHCRIVQGFFEDYGKGSG